MDLRHLDELIIVLSEDQDEDYEGSLLYDLFSQSVGTDTQIR